MRSNKLIGYIDHHGQIHEHVVPVLVGHKIQSPYGYSWMQINQQFLKEFASRRDLGNEVLRVFLYLNARLDFENVIQVPQVEIATDLGMQRQNVNRAIKVLEREGILLRGPKVGKSSSWRLNPQAGWKGKVVHLREAQRQQAETPE